ncbi:MAG: hypothetical protein KatS3mg102_1283 [Planctomycetota bacterium]|nr:MAG: hypothetical protein KatS3mg102_1283 [Planctomycetota bacterium]
MSRSRIAVRVLAAVAVLAVGLAGCGGASTPSGVAAQASAGGGGGGAGGGGSSGGGSGFRAFAFNDDLYFGTSQNSQGPVAWIWIGAEVKSGHSGHLVEEASSASGPWSPVSGQVWSGAAVDGGNASLVAGPGVLFTFPVPGQNRFYRVVAQDSSGNQVFSNVILADLAAAANPARLTITNPTVSNNPQNPPQVNAPSSIGWTAASGVQSYVVLLLDSTQGLWHTIVESSQASYTINTPGATEVLNGAGALVSGTAYSVEVIGLDGNGWGVATSADPVQGLDNFFQVN